MSHKERSLKIRGFVLRAEQRLTNADLSAKTSNFRVVGSKPGRGNE